MHHSSKKFAACEQQRLGDSKIIHLWEALHPQKVLRCGAGTGTKKEYQPWGP